MPFLCLSRKALQAVDRIYEVCLSRSPGFRWLILDLEGVYMWFSGPERFFCLNFGCIELLGV